MFLCDFLKIELFDDETLVNSSIHDFLPKTVISSEISNDSLLIISENAVKVLSFCKISLKY